MNPAVVQGILVAGPFLLGLGFAPLMYRVFDLVLTRLPGRKLLGNLLNVLGWFIGGGGVILGTLRTVDYTRLFPEAEVVALCCYFGGFGVGVLLIELWSKPSLVRGLNKYLSGDELVAVLLILRYSVSPEDAAATLGIPNDEMVLLFKSALKKINDRGKGLIKVLAEQSARPRSGSE